MHRIRSRTLAYRQLKDWGGTFCCNLGFADPNDASSMSRGPYCSILLQKYFKRLAKMIHRISAQKLQTFPLHLSGVGKRDVPIRFKRVGVVGRIAQPAT